jgi:glucose-6-phosphate dehydrogenase assembly protein OpcA
MSTVASISPAQILKDLDALWLSLGETHDDPNHTQAVLRACAMTLIAVVEGSGEEIGETLAMLVREHPSRLIVVPVTEGQEPHLEAGVTAQCWMPFGKRQQICCEQIVLAASTASLVEIPPVIRGLIVPDLPVACWVRGKSVLHTPELRGVLALADKLIVDSGGVSELPKQIQFLQESGVRRVGDLAWTRLTRWRQAIAQLFDDPQGGERARQLSSVRIEYQGGYVPMSAYYLAAWLSHSVGRELVHTFVRAGDSERARVCSVVLDGQGDDVSITVGTDRDVELHTGMRDAHTVFPRLTEYELLREELSVLGPDPIYEAVVRTVPRLLGAIKP